MPSCQDLHHHTDNLAHYRVCLLGNSMAHIAVSGNTPSSDADDVICLLPGAETSVQSMPVTMTTNSGSCRGSHIRFTHDTTIDYTVSM